jgi:hypothetical protein
MTLVRLAATFSAFGRELVVPATALMDRTGNV